MRTSFLDTVETHELPAHLHQRMVDWQKKYFPELDFMLENWSKHYRHEPFRLTAKLGPLKQETIEVGRLAGRPKFTKAADLDDEMIIQSAKIIKAQCSTELGSIQQHRGSLQKAQDPAQQFDVLRVMAEEFRHAYQMMFVLANDDWSKVGKDIAGETMDSLLGMETGEHVLDAFNLYFDSFVDNSTFCSIIDRVGKYQLEMQTVFSYAPMARSMGPMLAEEAFHMASGVNAVRKWAGAAARDEGNISIPCIQRHINKWVPRGLEMFGDERGGKSALQFGFKDMLNGEAMGKYFEEVKVELVDTLNWEILRARDPKVTRAEAPEIADRIIRTGEAEHGVKPDELLYVPSEKFYRRRGLYEFQRFDPRGNPVADTRTYLHMLRSSLPESYVSGPDFKRYLEHLTEKLAGKEVHEEGLPFYG
jgi:1,2-phenylacetyl-CoA epoxidase catalytic subunit